MKVLFGKLTLATEVNVAEVIFVKPAPPAGAAQASPVAVELSATKPRTISEDCAS